MTTAAVAAATALFLRAGKGARDRDEWVVIIRKGCIVRHVRLATSSVETRQQALAEAKGLFPEANFSMCEMSLRPTSRRATVKPCGDRTPSEERQK